MSRRRKKTSKRVVDEPDSDEDENYDDIMQDSKLVKNAAKVKSKKKGSSSSSSSSSSGLAPRQKRQAFVMPEREDRPDPDQMRILISSDSHLGYAETDQVRRDDSFVAFEEVLENAVKSNADFVLLGGDSFHENKPTRDTVYRSISSLRKYCLGNADVNIKMVSDGLKNFRGEPEFRRKKKKKIYILYIY